MPPVKIKRPVPPSLVPAKRIKVEAGSHSVPKPQVSPITIDSDSDIEKKDCPLLSAKEEVTEFDRLIKKARRRHKIQYGNREAAKEALALKHSLEEQAEQDEMKRLDGLRAAAASRLNR